jgi:hypothetical protein
VMIMLIKLARASWMTTSGWYPSPLLNPTGWWCGGLRFWLWVEVALAALWCCHG